MSSARLQAALLHLRRLLAVPAAGELTDGQVLDRFVSDHDESAFATLMHRHSPLVLGVGLRLLLQGQDAEDVLQATFLVLARKAASRRWQESVAGWLYRVAYRIAANLKAKSTKQRKLEQEAGAVPRTGAMPEPDHQELHAVLDQELHRLPDKYREPLLLCFLEGQTRDQAAQRLGWSVRTLHNRLEHGLNLLRKRLTERGVGLPVALLTAALSQQPAAASVSPALAATMVKTAVAFAKGAIPAGGGIAAEVVLLAEGGLKAMSVAKAKVGLVLLLAAGLAISGAGAVLRQTLAAQQAGEKQPAVPQPANKKAEAARPEPPTQQGRTDLFGDPLPAEAIARVGTARLRHGGVAWSVAFSPNGKLIASAGSDCTIRVWDVHTGKEVRRFPGDEYDRRVLFLSDGNTVVSVTNTGVHLWDVTTGREVRRLGDHACAALFAPDGKTLVVQAKPAIMQIWDLATGVELRQIKLPGNPAGLAVSSDGKTLAAALKDNKIHFYDVATGRESGQISAGVKPSTLAFSPNRKLLAFVGSDQTIRIIDIAARAELRTFKVEGQNGRIAFSPHNDVLASAVHDGTIRQWKVATGQEIGKYQCYYPIATFAFSPDGTLLAVPDFAGKINFVDAATGEERPRNPGAPDAASRVLFHIDDNTLVSWGNSMQAIHLGERKVRFWDAKTGKEQPLPSGFPGKVASLASAPDGETLAVNTWDSKVYLLDGKSGKEARQIPGKYQPVWFTPQGHTLTTLTEEGKSFVVQGWQLQPGKQIQQFRGPPDLPQPSRAAVSPDRKTLAMQSSELLVWSLTTGKELWRVPEIRSWTVFTFSRDARTMALTGILPKEVGAQMESLAPDEVQIRDSATGRNILKFGSQAQRFTALAFSPDGRTLVTGSMDGAVRSWEMATGSERQVFLGHDGRINTLDFSRNGSRLVSAADDGTALIWDLSATNDASRPQLVPSLKELECHWSDLASTDARQAYRAVRTLVIMPRHAVPFIQNHLRPSPVPDLKKISRLIADLNRDEFSTREKASQELEKLGDGATPAVRTALHKKSSVEAERRLSDLLQKLQGWSPEKLREWRALEVLETIGNADARFLLRAMANGNSEARVTQEAKAALERLARRPTVAP